MPFPSSKLFFACQITSDEILALIPRETQNKVQKSPKLIILPWGFEGKVRPESQYWPGKPLKKTALQLPRAECKKA